MSNHIHNIHLHNVDRWWWANNTWCWASNDSCRWWTNGVMHIYAVDERCNWQWRLWSRKLCSSYDIAVQRRGM